MVHCLTLFVFEQNISSKLLFVQTCGQCGAMYTSPFDNDYMCNSQNTKKNIHTSQLSVLCWKEIFIAIFYVGPTYPSHPYPATPTPFSLFIHS